MKRDYGPDADAYGFLLDFYIDELQNPRLIRFSRRYTIGSDIKRAGTPFREWDVVQLRNYKNGGLHVQKSTFLFIITEQKVEDLFDNGGQYVVSYEGVIVEKGAPQCEVRTTLTYVVDVATTKILFILQGWCLATVVQRLIVWYISRILRICDTCN